MFDGDVLLFVGNNTAIQDRDVRSNGFAPRARRGHVATGGRGEDFFHSLGSIRVRVSVPRGDPGRVSFLKKLNGARAGGNKCSRVGRVDNFFRGTTQHRKNNYQ